MKVGKWREILIDKLPIMIASFQGSNWESAGLIYTGQELIAQVGEVLKKIPLSGKRYIFFILFLAIHTKLFYRKEYLV